ncbi:MAG: LamG-like jellyroll fold domain-containing protein [Planctomycetota bacterium]
MIILPGMLSSARAAVLKSVQYGTVTLPADQSSVTDALSPSVVMPKSFLVFSISEDGNSDRPDEGQVSGQITATDTVTFERNASTGAPAITIKWYVAEFISGVSVQRGNLQMPDTGVPSLTTVALSPGVDATKSFPIISHHISGSAYDGNDFVRAKIINNGADLELWAHFGATPMIVQWQVVQYTDADVQTGDITFLDTDSSKTADLSADPIDPDKSWLIYTFKQDAAGVTIGEKLIRGVITDGSTLTFDRDLTGASDVELTWYLVEFTDATTVQHNTEDFTTAETQQDVTITSVDLDRSIAAGGYYMRGGKSPYNLGHIPGTGWFTLDLTSGTNLRITRGTTGPTTPATADVGWFVVQFSTNNDNFDDPGTDYTLDDNMVSWWYLDESSGTRYDGSSNNNDLTDNNTVTAYSTTNQSVKEGAAAASFDRTNSETLTITDASQTGLDITGNLTLVAWIRLASVAADRGIIAKTDGTSDKAYYLYLNAGPPAALRAKVSNDGSSQVTVQGGTTLVTNTWYHVALVYNGTDLRLYLNGSLDENGALNPLSYSSGINNSSTAFAIGSQSNLGEYFDGQIDEVAVFDRDLSADEIQEIYEKGLNGVTRMRPDAAQPPVPYFGRSIGEDTTGPVDSPSDTVTLNQGSRRATFSSASLPTNIGEGDVLTIGGSTTYYIASRESATEVIVQEANISGSDHSAATYTITRAYSGADQTPFQNGTDGWEDERQGNLVTDDAIQRGIVYKDSDGVFAFTASATIDGSTTDSSHFMWLTAHASARHSGTAGSGVAADGSNTTAGIGVSDDYSRVEWLELKQFGGANGRPSVQAQDATNVLFSKLIIHSYDTGGFAAYGIKGSDNSGFIARNCIVYNGSSSGIRSNGTNSTGTIENCTIFNITGNGVGEDNGTYTVRNTVSMNNSGVDFNISTGTQEYNISSDGTATGTGSMANRTATANSNPGAGDWVVFTNITAGSEDFHLQSSSENDALNNADNLSGSFTDDIDNHTRPSGTNPWDIGADELMAGSLKKIYYSVGTSAADLKSGSPTMTIANGTATFSEGQPDNIGVGDVITYDTSDTVYISGRTSSTVYSVQTVTGNTPADVIDATVNSIKRSFNSLTNAITNSSGASYLNTSDLVSGNYQLNWPCYKDAVMDDLPVINASDYITGADNYIRIYTPVDTSEVGTSQRHDGTAGTGFVLQYTPDPNELKLFEIHEEYVRIEGIELDGSQTQPSGVYGFYVKDVSATSDVRFDKVIVHDLTKDNDVDSQFLAAGIYFSDGSGRVTNSIVYDITNNNANASASATAIRTGLSSDTVYLYNNTVYNVVNNGSSAAVYGIYAQGGTVTATNNYAGGTSCGSCGANNYDYSGTITANYNISEDDTADDNGGAGNLIGKVPANQFVDPTPAVGEPNLHLKAGADCINAGDDLTSTFSDDIDADTRPTGVNTWDVGADERPTRLPLTILTRVPGPRTTPRGCSLT